MAAVSYTTSWDTTRAFTRGRQPDRLESVDLAAPTDKRTDHRSIAVGGQTYWY